MADIDNLSFNIILNEKDFETKLTQLETRAKQFNLTVETALNLQAMLSTASDKGAKAAASEAESTKKIAEYTRIGLMNKERAGTITKQEEAILTKIRSLQKALIGVERERLSTQARGLIAEMQKGRFTEVQLNALRGILSLEKARLAASDKAEAAERRAAESAERAALAEQRKGAAIDMTNAKLGTQSALLAQIKSYLGMYFSVMGGVRLIGSLVRITGEFEAQHVALRAILQDAQGADRIFGQLQELAVKSPYTFQNLTSYAKQLSAFSVPMDEIYETTKKLADVSAGLGVDMARIILAYGQVRSAAYLRGQELRQFTEAGIPLLKLLAEQFEELEGRAISTGEVFQRISARQVPFAMVAEAFNRMTSEGGKFYNMQEVLAETVQGKLSNLKDAWQIMLSNIGNTNSGLIKGTIDALRKLMENYELIGRTLTTLVITYGVYKTAIGAAAIAQNGLAASSTLLSAALGKLQIALNFLKAHPAVAAFTTLAAVLTAVWQEVKAYREEQEKLNNIIAETNNRSETEVAVLGTYFRALERAAYGTKEYDKARTDLEKHAGNYLSQVDREKIAIGDLAGVYDNLVEAIKRANKERGLEQGKSEIDKQETEDIQKRVLNNLKVYSTETQAQIMRYFRGEMTRSDLYDYLLDLPDKEIKKYTGAAWRGLKGKDNWVSLVLRRLNEFKDAYDDIVTTATNNRKELENKFELLYGDLDAPEGWISKVKEYVGANELPDKYLPKPQETYTAWKSRLDGIVAAADRAIADTTLKAKDIEKYNDKVSQTSEASAFAKAIFRALGIGEDANLSAEQRAINDYIEENGRKYGDIAISALRAESTTEMKEWRKKAAEMLDEDSETLASIPLQYKRKSGETIEAWRERMNGNIYAIAEARTRFLKDMSMKFYGDEAFGGVTKQYKRDAKDAKALVQEQISDTKQLVEDLKVLRKYYDDLLALGFSESEAKAILKSYHFNIPSEDFSVLLEQYAKQLEALGAVNDAQDVRNYATGKDLSKDIELIKSATAETDKWRNALEDLQATARMLGMDGFAAELDKIIVDTDAKNRKLQTDWMQKERSLEEAKEGWKKQYTMKNANATAEAAEEAWKKYYDAQVAMAKGSIDKQIAYNNKVAQENINDKAQSWLKDMMFKEGISLTDLGDKSLAQLNTLIERMQSLVSDKALAQLLPTELVKDAELVNVSFTELLSNIRKIANTKIGDLRVEKMKKVASGVKAVLSQLGLSTDTNAVSEAYSTLQQRLVEVANAQEDAAKAQKAYDEVHAAGRIDEETAAYLNLVDALKKLKEAQEKASESQAQFVASLTVASLGAFASMLKKVGDGIKKIGEAADDAEITAVGDAFSRLSQNLNAAAAGFAAAYSAGAGAYSWIGAVVGGVADILGQVFGVIEDHKKLLTQNERWLKDYEVAYKASLLEMAEFTDLFGDQIARSGREAYDKLKDAAAQAREVFAELKKSKVITDHQSWIEGNDTQWQYLTDLYPGLFDKNGHLNLDLAKQLQNSLTTGSNSGNDWNAKLRDLLAQAVSTEEAWQKAKDALDGYIKSFTGDWASNLADAMWDAVASGEDAWDEWRRVASDAISAIGKQMLAEMIQTAWLGKYEKELENAFSSGDSPDVVWKKVADIAYKMFADVDANYDKYLEITEAWQSRMVAAGYTLNANESEAGKLSNGIKSITEDTADLLAAYINAIRADVSYGKGLWERMTVALESIAGTGETPSLAEYMSRIEAHTANIAFSNTQILNALQSVITLEGGLPSIRNYSA